METTATSQDAQLAEELLRFFVEIDSKECFAACLYHCYTLIKPDVVLELAWRFNLMNLAMPFMIQTMRTLSTKIEELEQTKTIVEEKVLKQPSAAEAAMMAATGVIDDSMNDGSAYYDRNMAMQYQTMIATSQMTDSMAYNQFSYYGQ
jgi:clathrin heavy chain